MNEAHQSTGRLTRRQVLGVLSAAGINAGLSGTGLAADTRPPASSGLTFLLGLDGWSLSFAAGMRRRELKPTKQLTAWDILSKVRHWGLKGAQVEILSMPKLGTDDFAAFRKAVAEAKLFWEVRRGQYPERKGSAPGNRVQRRLGLDRGPFLHGGFLHPVCEHLAG